LNAEALVLNAVSPNRAGHALSERFVAGLLRFWINTFKPLAPESYYDKGQEPGIRVEIQKHMANA
jgi:hypothetical protein